MRETRIIVTTLALCLAAGCKSATIAEGIEAAQGKAAWVTREAVACDITVAWGGSVMLSGSMIYEPGGGRVRMETDEGAVLVFDGRHAWVSPPSAEVRRARFQLLTWPYFLALPFKLNDPGTHLAPHGRRPLNGGTCATALLTFDAGVGDTPDDWYVVYQDPATGRLAAVAYIVTYGRTVAEAEEQPHAVVYEDYRTIDGVTLSTRWVLHNWSLAEGVYGDPLGVVTLANVRFAKTDEADFAPPADSREDLLPD